MDVLEDSCIVIVHTVSLYVMEYSGLDDTSPLSQEPSFGSIHSSEVEKMEDDGRYDTGEQSREISGLHGTDCHSKVCVWCKGLRCVDGVCGRRCFLSNIINSSI